MFIFILFLFFSFSLQSFTNSYEYMITCLYYIVEYVSTQIMTSVIYKDVESVGLPNSREYYNIYIFLKLKYTRIESMTEEGKTNRKHIFFSFTSDITCILQVCTVRTLQMGCYVWTLTVRELPEKGKKTDFSKTEYRQNTITIRIAETSVYTCFAVVVALRYNNDNNIMHLKIFLRKEDNSLKTLQQWFSNGQINNSNAHTLQQLRTRLYRIRFTRFFFSLFLPRHYTSRARDNIRALAYIISLL